MSRLMTKPTKWCVHPAKIRSAWASTQSDQSSLSAWRKLGSLATHLAHSKDSDQTGWMLRLIWVFAGPTVFLLVLSWGGETSRSTQEVVFLGLYFTGCWLDIGQQKCTIGSVSWPIFHRLLTEYWPAEMHKRWCFLTYISQAADWILASRNAQEVVFLDLYFTGCWLDIGQQKYTRGGVSWPIFHRLLTGCWPAEMHKRWCFLTYISQAADWILASRNIQEVMFLDLYFTGCWLDIGQQEYTRGCVSWPIFHRLLTGYWPAGIYKRWCFLTYISQAADWILASRNTQDVCFLTYISQAADWILASRKIQDVMFHDLYFTGCWLDIGQQKYTRGSVFLPIFHRLLTGYWPAEIHKRWCFLTYTSKAADFGYWQEYTRGGVSWPIFLRLLTGYWPTEIHKRWCFLTYISQAADWI